jgi:5-(carboxyamino)imidazole ribonucleotide synthase
MAVAQSKALQRQRFAALGLPLPPFAVARPGEAIARVTAFGQEHGWPMMVKADRGGYDGRGVWVASNAEEAEDIVRGLAGREITAVFEQRAPIEREVAILIARRTGGEVATYPLVETVQVDGMLRELRAPAGVDPELEERAREYAAAIAQNLDVVGMLAVEFFVSDGRLLVNEIATRPHNSGHYTIEGAVTSQFEQHLRAVLDLPLGSTGLTGRNVATVNVVGNDRGEDPRARLDRALAVDGAHVHLYGKSPRPGRKLGHVTVVSDRCEEALVRARKAVAILEGRDGDG